MIKCFLEKKKEGVEARAERRKCQARVASDRARTPPVPFHLRLPRQKSVRRDMLERKGDRSQGRMGTRDR